MIWLLALAVLVILEALQIWLTVRLIEVGKAIGKKFGVKF